MKFRIVILMMILSVFLATGCAPTTLESNPAGPIVTPETPENNDNENPVGEGAGDNESMETPDNNNDSMETPILSSGEVPQEFFDAVLDDLLTQTGGARSDVEVIQAESVTWNDGSLGCPQPGVMYTQAIIDGYQVQFRLDGQTYDYHLSDRGAFVLCGGLR